MRKNRSSNGSTEGQKNPTDRRTFWLQEYAYRINSGKYPKHVVERYTKLYNEIMSETKNLSFIDPTLK
jgi:hypothetical protein